VQKKVQGGCSGVKQRKILMRIIIRQYTQKSYVKETLCTCDYGFYAFEELHMRVPYNYTRRMLCYALRFNGKKSKKKTQKNFQKKFPKKISKKNFQKKFPKLFFKKK
jgi:hypothetical protein